ncbi:carbohydrate ABC transporter permease [Ruminococcus sp. 5_1_39BFAA]|uniref:carbohydrate ABC transporter permease n=1 Tax=Ruminococcus sp. 5_1_39BFAA TaxID=457412 RepID=UPI003566E534
MNKTRTVVTSIILGLVSIISLIPFWLMFSMSTYKSEMIFQNNPMIPSDYFIENLKTIFASNFVQSYVNSFIISASAMLLSVIICSMAGYAMNVYEFKLKKIVNMFIMMTMMVPTQIGIIGYMIEMRNMKINNTLLPMILVWLASGLGAYWMISFFKSGLPLELVESARIDGASEPKIFCRIALPCIKPGILTLCLLQFLWSWNSYMYPLVFVNKAENYTIPIFVKSLASAYRTDYGAQLAGLTLSTIPVLILFMFGSKSMIRGLTAGAVKG